MDSPRTRSEDALEENRRLRRTMRDLVALSTLPAIWTGLAPDGIIRSLADVLQKTLSLDLVYIRLVDPAGDSAIEVVRGDHLPHTPVDTVRTSLAPILEAAEPPATVSNPLGLGTLRIAVTRFGVGDDSGVIVAGSREEDFPAERDRVLLGVGANQTAIVLQRRRTEDRLHERQEWLRVTLASIGDAVIATDTEGHVTFLNHVAQVLTGWDASEAEGKPLDMVFPILHEQTRRRVSSPVDKVLKVGRTVGLGNHTVLVAKDGTERPIDDAAAPIRDAAGKLLGVVLTFRDVTEGRRAEARLRESEARKSAILANALDCIIAMDHEGNVVEFNPAAERTFGYRRDEIMGRPLADFIIPSHLRERHRRGLAHYLATGQSEILGKRIEITALRADDSEFPTELAITPTPTDGPPVFTAYLRDISERARDERHRSLRLQVTQVLAQATTLSEAAGALLKAVCQSLGWEVGLFWMLGPDGDTLHCCESWHAPGVTITQFEAASRQQVFRRGEGLPGRAWDLAEPTWLLDSVEAANFPRAASAAAEGLHSAFACPLVGKNVLGVVEFFSQQLREPDSGLLETMSTVAGLVGQFVERRQAEEALKTSEAEAARRREELVASLRESEEKLRLLADTIPQLAWMAQPDGHIFWFNRRWYEYTGTTPAEMEGWGWTVVHDPEVLPDVLARWTRSIANEEPFDMVFPLRGADGRLRPFLTRVNPFRDAQGAVLYWFGTNTDISEIKRMEEALRETDRRKDEFLATLAHELRNPLAPIQNSLQILKMPRLDAETAQQTRSMMERQVHHLVRLVDDLLDVSRVMRGKIELRREPVELATVVARAVETAQPLIEMRGHELDISFPPESLLLHADPVRLTQITANLLTNAAKYTEPGGHIWVSGGRDGDQAVLHVRDDGIGIDAEALPHVFDLFVQVDHATTRSQGGLGIGLTLAKNLVEMHGGAMEVDSPGLGEGCNFVVRLPLSAQPPSDSPEADSRPPEEIVVSGHRLLVVDDNTDAALTLAMLLELHGHEVRVVHDGASALEAVQDFHPSLVFLDLGMPGMDGYEVARRIRKMPGRSDTRLAALTGWGQPDDRRRTAEAGFDHHLVKPPEPNVLESLLASLAPHEA